MWADMPWFHDLMRQAGSEIAAFDKLSGLASPVARYDQPDLNRLITMLLTEEPPVTGATLVVDGGYTL
jgi:hypothetical protein